MNCWGREPRLAQMYRRSSLLALLCSTELTGPVVRAIAAQSGAAHYGSRGARHGDRTAGLDDGLQIPHRSDVRRHAEKGADPIVEAIMAADGIDPRQPLVSLRKTASKVAQLTQGRESREKS